MRKILLSACFLLAAAAPELAAAAAAGPTSLGIFADWTSAEYTAGGSHVCYAFTRALGAAKLPTAPMIIVSERPASRDEVVVNAASAYPAKTEVAVQIDAQPPISFYTSGIHAYARDGRATVIGMQKGNQAVASWKDKGGHDRKETFSLAGFSAAYGAIVKACPAK
ncbi:invasion associated locus B family protein [Acidisoma sp. C75]